MNRRIVMLPLAVLTMTLLIGPVPVAQAATAKPSSISKMVVKPGSRVGEIAVTWKSKGKNTRHFRVEAALSNFNPNKASSLPARGRNYKAWAVSPKARSVTLTAKQLSSIGASVASANHVYIRVTPYNYGSSGWRAGKGAKTKSMFVRPQTPVGSGSWIRVASFNIRSAPSTLGSKRAWPTRAAKVAKTIIDHRPYIIALQEVSPGPYSGKSGTARQTEDLMARLRIQGGQQYAMVRTTPYVKPGTKMGSQGARIVYDTRRYALLSRCPEKTGNANYNPSCSVITPSLPGESGGNRRPAAIAKFKDLASGQNFWMASVHLDNRDAVKYENLRATQINTVLKAIAAQNSAGDPVILAGDFNSWQNNDPYNNAPHNVLINQGFYDTAAAWSRVNMQYGTMNHFDTTMRKSASVHGSRLDVIVAKGIVGSSRFVNVMAVRDSARASDHNMIYSEIRFR